MGAEVSYWVVIVEDDRCQAESILELIDRFPQHDLLRSTVVSGPSDFRKLLEVEGRQPDIVFMDIRFDAEGASGIDAVRETIRPGSGTQVIYVTGYMNYCVEVYQTDHAYFLVKPVEQRLFDDALSKALANLTGKTALLGIKVGRTIKSIHPWNVSYIESVRRKVRIYSGNEVIEAYASLADLSSKLPQSFVRCHGSYLVNMDYIEELGKDGIKLRSSKVIPVSQARRKATREAFLEYVESIAERG